IFEQEIVRFLRDSAGAVAGALRQCGRGRLRWRSGDLALNRSRGFYRLPSRVGLAIAGGQRRRERKDRNQPHPHAQSFPNYRRTGKRLSMGTNDDLIQPDRGQDAIGIRLVCKESLGDLLRELSIPQRSALAAQKFTGGGYQVGIVPDGEGWFALGGVADP